MPRAGSKKNMSVTLTKQRSTSIERLRQAKRHLDIANRYSFEEDNLADHVSSIQRDKSLDGLQQRTFTNDGSVLRLEADRVSDDDNEDKKKQ